MKKKSIMKLLWPVTEASLDQVAGARIGRRQAMRILGWLLGAVLVVASATGAQAETRKTRQNRQRAEAYCADKRAAGEECKVSKTVGCGVGWTKDRKFRDGGNAYYACKRTAYHNASESNKQECLAWCRGHSDRCVACSTKPGCGIGFKRVKRFGGQGNNWYACEARYAGNKAECEAWCADNEQCVRCYPTVGCGVGQTSMKKFDTYRSSATYGDWTDFFVMLGEAAANMFDGSAWYACKRR
jgi:hypothetical protein